MVVVHIVAAAAVVVVAEVGRNLIVMAIQNQVAAVVCNHLVVAAAAARTHRIAAAVVAVARMQVVVVGRLKRGVGCRGGTGQRARIIRKGNDFFFSGVDHDGTRRCTHVLETPTVVSSNYASNLYGTHHWSPVCSRDAG